MPAGVAEKGASMDEAVRVTHQFVEDLRTHCGKG
jgi:hypothetical protein